MVVRYKFEYLRIANCLMVHCPFWVEQSTTLTLFRAVCGVGCVSNGAVFEYRRRFDELKNVYVHICLYYYGRVSKFVGFAIKTVFDRKNDKFSYPTISYSLNKFLILEKRVLSPEKFTNSQIFKPYLLIRNFSNLFLLFFK